MPPNEPCKQAFPVRSVVHFGYDEFALGFITPFFNPMSRCSHNRVTFVGASPKVRAVNNQTYSVSEYNLEGMMDRFNRFGFHRPLDIDYDRDREKIVEAIAKADVVTFAVDLTTNPRMTAESIAEYLCKGILSRAGPDKQNGRRPVTVIDCGQHLCAPDVFGKLFDSWSRLCNETEMPQREGLRSRMTFTHSSVDQLISPGDIGFEAVNGPIIKIEERKPWIIDDEPFLSLGRAMPKIDGSEFTGNFYFYTTRKLYLTSLSQVVTAYFALQRMEVTYIHEAIKVDEIKAKVRKVLLHTSTLLPHLATNLTGVTSRSTNGAAPLRKKWIEVTLERLGNPAIEITPEWVIGQEPFNRLTKFDCLIEPAAKLADWGHKEDWKGVDLLIPIIKMALQYVSGNDSRLDSTASGPTQAGDSGEALRQKLQTHSPHEFVAQVMGVERDHALFERLVTEVERAQRKVPGSGATPYLPGFPSCFGGIPEQPRQRRQQAQGEQEQRQQRRQQKDSRVGRQPRSTESNVGGASSSSPSRYRANPPNRAASASQSPVGSYHSTREGRSGVRGESPAAAAAAAAEPPSSRGPRDQPSRGRRARASPTPASTSATIVPITTSHNRPPRAGIDYHQHPPSRRSRSGPPPPPTTTTTPTPPPTGTRTRAPDTPLAITATRDLPLALRDMGISTTTASMPRRDNPNRGSSSTGSTINPGPGPGPGPGPDPDPDPVQGRGSSPSPSRSRHRYRLRDRDRGPDHSRRPSSGGGGESASTRAASGRSH